MLNGIIAIVLAVIAFAAYWFLSSDYYFNQNPNQKAGAGKIVGLYRNEKRNTVQYKIQFEGEDGRRYHSNSLEYRENDLYQEGSELVVRYLVISCFGREIVPVRIDDFSLHKAENYSIFTMLGAILLIFGALSIFLEVAG